MPRYAEGSARATPLRCGVSTGQSGLTMFFENAVL